MEKKLSFEEEFSLLKEALKKIEDAELGIEVAISAYEDGLKHYKNCENLLNDCKQRVEMIEK